MLPLGATTRCYHRVLPLEDDEDAKTKYTGPTKHNVVMYNGKKTVIYGSRLMIDHVMAYILEYGDNLASTDLVVAFRETLRNAAVNVGEGNLMNYAIVQALRDARDEWKVISNKGGTSTAPTDRRANNSFGRAAAMPSGRSPVRPPPPDKPATIKGCCGPYNRREDCSNGNNCRNGEHKCTICGKPGHGASSLAFHAPNAAGTKRARGARRRPPRRVRQRPPGLQRHLGAKMKQNHSA